MAQHCLFSRFALLSSFALLLVIQPHSALGSNHRRVSGRKAPQPVGVCSEAVTVRGYKCQEFVVKTDDGYLLSVQRIGQRGAKSKGHVLLQHGVLVDGMTWVLNPPDESLAFVLVDNGFDVWIANTRGTRFSSRHINLNPDDPDGMTWVLNPPDESLAFVLVDNGFDVWIANTRATRFSSRHINLNPDDPEFWNWTWDDLVAHDLPAVIDFVFKQTGQKIHYVGHSMGTLVALASFSERREVEKVKSAALLSPIAYLSHMTTAIGDVAARTFVGEFTKLFGLAEFNPIGKPVINLLKAMCAQPGIDCYDLLSAFTGKNCCLNSSTVDLFLKHEPQPTSTKNMIHLAQTVRDGQLSKYDYGNTQYNLEHYGERKPPSYNLSNIPNDLPLFLSYGGQDALSDVRDVQILLDSLKLHDPNKISIQYIEHFAHADFIMGVTAKDLVYNQIIKFFESKSNL